jgi:hypothetical protein
MLPLGVASPGADHAFLAAEFVAFARRGVERARYSRLDGVAMGAAGIGHVDRKRGAGAAHGQRGGTVTLALLARRRECISLARIVEGLAISTAFADGERARGPRLRCETCRGQRQGQKKNVHRAALRVGQRRQKPLPEVIGRNLSQRMFQLGEREVEMESVTTITRAVQPRAPS